jgi:hypothetical protein
MGRAKGSYKPVTGRRRNEAAGGLTTLAPEAAQELMVSVAMPAPAWDEPGGPEATDAERLAWSTSTGEGGIHAPSRRGLEAALAAYHGVPLADYKLTNAHRAWGELAADAVSPSLSADYSGGKLHRLGWKAEDNYKSAEYHTGPPQPFAVAAPSTREEDAFVVVAGNGRSFVAQQSTGRGPSPAIAQLIAKLGPGQRSGKLEDYTRAELRKLLGYLERDCAHLTDDDLRGMALDGHLVPRWRGAPSHAELAARWESTRQFKKSMRMKYGDLCRLSSYSDASMTLDDGSRNGDAIRAELAVKNPFVVGCGDFLLGGDELADLAKRNGVATTRPESERYRVAEGAATKKRTPLELKYGDAFTGFVDSFGGARKLGEIRTGLTGTFGRRARRGVVAFYESHTGHIYINAADARSLTSSTASPGQIERNVSTVAHELFHAMEGNGDGTELTGANNSHRPHHCLDEGGTEALARLHCQDLAERMGLWSADKGSLRAHATSGSYGKEVETMVAVAALCNGEMDMERLSDGGYKEPEVLSTKARDWLRDLHLRHGPSARITVISETLRARNEARGGQLDMDSRVLQILRECKDNKYQHRTQRVLAEPGSGRTWKTEYLQPEALGENLASIFEEINV